MTQLDVKEAGARLADLIARVRAGEEVVIAEDGKPVAKLSAVVENTREKALGMFEGRIWMSDDFQSPLTDEELKDWGK